MKIQDIMEPHMVTISEAATLKELMSLVSRYGRADFPVVNDRGVFLGMVTEKNVLKVLYPDERARPSNISEPDYVREILTRYDQIKMTEIMITDVKPLDADSDILGAAPLVMLDGTARIPVFKNNHLIGVISQVRLIGEILAEFSSRPQDFFPQEKPQGTARLSSPPMAAGEERRFFRRVDIEIPVAYRPTHVKGEGAGRLGTTINISGGGILLRTADRLIPDTEIDVAFGLLKNGTPFKVTCKIVRCVPSQEEGYFQTGLLFIDIDTQDRVKIIAHLDKIVPPEEGQ